MTVRSLHARHAFPRVRVELSHFLGDDADGVMLTDLSSGRRHPLSVNAKPLQQPSDTTDTYLAARAPCVNHASQHSNSDS